MVYPIGCKGRQVGEGMEVQGMLMYILKKHKHRTLATYQP
jgi:hypothetical protein